MLPEPPIPSHASFAMLIPTVILSENILRYTRMDLCPHFWYNIVVAYVCSANLVVGERAKRPLMEDFYLNSLNVEEHYTLSDILSEFPRLCRVR